MFGLVGITLLQLLDILQKGTEEIVRFCRLAGLLGRKFKCPVCKSTLTYLYEGHSISFRTTEIRLYLHGNLYCFSMYAPPTSIQRCILSNHRVKQREYSNFVSPRSDFSTAAMTSLSFENLRPRNGSFGFANSQKSHGARSGE